MRLKQTTKKCSKPNDDAAIGEENKRIVESDTLEEKHDARTTIEVQKRLKRKNGHISSTERKMVTTNTRTPIDSFYLFNSDSGVALLYIQTWR